MDLLPTIITASPFPFKELFALLGPVKLMVTFLSFFLPTEAFKSRIGIWVYRYLVVDRQLQYTQVIKHLALLGVYYWYFDSGLLVACTIAALLADLIGHYVYQDRAIVRRRTILNRYIKKVAKK